MTDVPVSNARRISFTALALVAFWVLVWRAYWFGADHEFLTGGSNLARLGFEDGRDGFVNNYRHAIIGLTFVAVPTALLMLSAGNSLRRWRTPSIVLCGLLIAICTSFICWLGQKDSYWRRVSEISYGDLGLGSKAQAYQSSGLRAQQVSWLWLLLPIILTTAIVIFGAWRRAVRDGEIEPVDPDE